jgi:hypothetical protein
MKECFGSVSTSALAILWIIRELRVSVDGVMTGALRSQVLLIIPVLSFPFSGLSEENFINLEFQTRDCEMEISKPAWSSFSETAQLLTEEGIN